MRIAIGLLTFTLGLTAQDAPAASWSGTTPLAEARQSACAVRLNDGRVLVAGGTGVDGPLASAELYQTDASFVPASPMLAARSRHVCVLLVDGRVLVTGGEATGLAELYDPVANSWQPVDGMGKARAGAAIVLLRDRRVLIAGGSGPDGVALNSIEVFNPEEGTLTPLNATLTVPRDGLAAVRQGDGTVLFIGGTNTDGVLSATDLFSPVDDSVAPGPPLNVARTSHSATALLEGRILVAGGFDGNQELDSAELYDPTSGTFALLDAKMQTARRDHLAIFVPGNGGAVFAGGRQGDQALVATEFFQPLDGTFQRLGDLTAPRYALAGAVAGDGVILATGGLNSDGPQAACGLLLLPTIQFDKTVYRPGDQVRVSGSNFRPNAKVTFILQLVTGTTSARIDGRLVTSSVTVPPGGQFQLLNSFPAVAIVNTTATDVAKSVRLTAQLPDGSTLLATATVRNATSITFNQPTGLYEGFDATFLSQLIRTTGAAPLSGAYAFTASPATTCAGTGITEITDGTSNTVVIPEAPASSGITGTLNLNGNLGSPILSPQISIHNVSRVKLVATYVGDAGNDPAAASSCFSAASRGTSVQLSVPPGSLQAGTPFNLNAKVQSQDGTPHTPLLGVVKYSLEGFPLSAPSPRGTPRPVSFLTFTDSQPFTPLTVGTLNFTAQYTGDPFFKDSTSLTLPVNVQKATTTLSLVNPPSTFQCDAPFSTNVRLNFPPSLGLANNSVALFVNQNGVILPGQANATLTVTSPGVATGTMTIPSTKAASTSIQASFNGDGLLLPSMSSIQSLTLATSPVTVEVIQPSSNQPNPVTFFVRVTPQGCSAHPTGNIEILDGGVPVIVVQLSSVENSTTHAVDAIVTLSRPQGSHSIQAQYSGDRAYRPATSAATVIVFQ